MSNCDCNLTGRTHLHHRRGFLGKLTAIFAGAVALFTPTAVGIVAFLNPLRQKNQAGGFIRVASLDAVPEDGAPQRFPVISDRTDAWTFYPNEPIGAIFLRRAGKDQVEALQVVCPHAGCTITFEAVKDDRKFYCPCHGASFDLSGKRLGTDSPSPRDMDSLEVEIREKTEIWVKFQSFVSGIALKKTAVG